MKTVLVILGFLCAFTVVAQRKSIELPRIDLTETPGGNFVFKIEEFDSEVTLTDNLIKRIDLGKSTASVTYFNRTKKSMSPHVKYRLFNAYGMEVAQCYDHWITGLGPGEVSVQSITIFEHRLDEILEYSNFAIPADIQKRVYMIVEKLD